MADRTQRIQSIIGKNISEIIQFELRNPNIGYCTVSEVWVSADFSYAKVYVSFIIEDQASEGMKTLEKSKGFIRSELAKRLDIRRCPELTFVLDEAYKKEERITELLNNAKK